VIVQDLAPRQLQQALHGPGLNLRTGPVVTRIRSHVPAVERGIAMHYAGHPVEADDAFADFHVSVDRPTGLRRWVHPQVVFRFDGEEPFAPLPGPQGFPLLEWGLNWCIYTYCQQYVTLHSAVLARDGRALMLPAPSGSGKSTLCAGLAFRGWRLLSDELTVFEPATRAIVPVPRPISLKNRSVDVIRDFAPQAVFSPAVPDTAKGTVAHVRPPGDAVQQAQARAQPRWIVLPRYSAGAPARLVPAPRSRVLMALVQNTFNYSIHGPRAFELLAEVTERCDCYEFTYGDLDEAVALFDRLAADTPA
jgi:HprK-related kinase A